MTMFQVFDRPMCCSTGVWGPTADPVLARFAADLEWLKGQGVTVERYNLAHHSAGSRSSGKVNPRAVQFMQELGYDLSRHDSKSLDQFNGTEIDVAVTVGCGDACPLVRARRREEWQIPGPKELPDDAFRRVRDLIEQKVKELLASR